MAMTSLNLLLIMSRIIATFPTAIIQDDITLIEKTRYSQPYAYLAWQRMTNYTLCITFDDSLFIVIESFLSKYRLLDCSKNKVLYIVL